jgi:hypothetical protein
MRSRLPTHRPGGLPQRRPWSARASCVSRGVRRAPAPAVTRDGLRPPCCADATWSRTRSRSARLVGHMRPVCLRCVRGRCSRRRCVGSLSCPTSCSSMPPAVTIRVAQAWHCTSGGGGVGDRRRHSPAAARRRRLARPLAWRHGCTPARRRTRLGVAAHPARSPPARGARRLADRRRRRGRGWFWLPRARTPCARTATSREAAYADRPGAWIDAKAVWSPTGVAAVDQAMVTAMRWMALFA